MKTRSADILPYFKRQGKIGRKLCPFWRDGFNSRQPKLNTDIDIEYWRPDATNTYSLFTSAGHNVYNYLNYYNYYVVMSDNPYPNCTPKEIYNNWNPFTFVGNENGGVADTEDEKVKGSALCVWCDEPNCKTEREVFSDIKTLIHVNGAKAWDADCNRTKSFRRFIKEID